MELESLFCIELRKKLKEKIRGKIKCYIDENIPDLIDVEIINKNQRISYKTQIRFSDMVSGYKTITRIVDDIKTEYSDALYHAFFK